jgi:putative transposase
MPLHEEFGLSVGRYDLSRPQELGLLACERPAQGLQAACRGHGRVQKNFTERVVEIRAKLAPDTPVEVWFQDEMRVSQKNKLTYRWARKGSCPRAAHDQRTQSTYLFGAVCPERGAGAALVLPACNTEAIQLHLNEIATQITPGAHAILLLDQAGWHGAKALKVPSNISLLRLPPRAPELNGQENIWQFMRQNWLSNRIFNSFDDIVDHWCYAWNTLIDQPWKIMSIACRDWAAAGHSI